MTTLEEHRKRLEERNEQRNKAHLSPIKNRQKAIQQFESEEYVQGKLMLADPALEPFVCDTEFHFQARNKFKDCGQVAELLVQQFPQGVSVCDEDDGYFYISRLFYNEVSFFLHSKARFTTSENFELTLTSPEGIQKYQTWQQAHDYCI